MHLAGPPPRWLIGNLGQIIKFGYPKALQQWAQQYGPVFKVGMCRRNVCCMLYGGAVAVYRPNDRVCKDVRSLVCLRRCGKGAMCSSWLRTRLRPELQTYTTMTGRPSSSTSWVHTNGNNEARSCSTCDNADS